jgi:hypothetical protein
MEHPLLFPQPVTVCGLEDCLGAKEARGKPADKDYNTFLWALDLPEGFEGLSNPSELENDIKKCPLNPALSEFF